MCTYLSVWKYIHEFLSIKKAGYKKVQREGSNVGKTYVYGNEKGKVRDQKDQSYRWAMWW